MSSTGYEMIGVFLLLVVNAFFVVAEFAIVKVRETRIAELAAEGSRSARVADHISVTWRRTSRPRSSASPPPAWGSAGWAPWPSPTCWALP